MTHLRSALALVLGFALSAAAQAQITVTDPWVRGTVAQQKASGLFAVITSAQGGKLVAGSSPVAGVVEVHEMTMDGSTMKMRQVAGGLPLPAGQAVELKPGGYHIMLMDLKAPLAKGAQLPLTLVFKDAQGAERRLDLQLPVSATPPGGAGGHGAPMHKQH